MSQIRLNTIVALLAALLLGACGGGSPVMQDAAGAAPGVEGLPGAGRDTSMPPLETISAPQLEWRPATRELHWRYANVGDYNRDGVVDLADITAVVQYLFDSAPFDEAGPAFAADGDRNGEVNAADIEVIARNYQTDVESYRVYAATGPGLFDVPGGARLVGEVQFGAGVALGNRTAEYSFELPAAVAEACYRVVPVSEGVEGAASNVVAISQPPVARLFADPPAGTVPLEVRLDATLSTPGSGTLVDYSWDLDGNGAYEFSSGARMVLRHTFEGTGDITVGLKVTNDAGFISTATAVVSVGELGFVFNPWRETIENNGYYDELKTVAWQSGSRGFVEIRALNCRGVEGLFGDLAYDETAYRLLDYVLLPGDTRGWDWEDLVVHGADQRLHIGLALLNPQELPGLYGDVVLIRLRFDLLPADTEYTRPRPPATIPFAVTSLGYDKYQSVLAWRYRTRGDFNQDGSVLVSDLKVFARYYGEDVPIYPGNIQRLLDTERDELITLGDVQAVGAEYRVSLDGYNAYAGNAADYPGSPEGSNGAGAVLLGFIPLTAADRGNGAEVLKFTLAVPPEYADAWFWVRPVLNGEEGIASNLVEPGGGLYISPDFTDADWEAVFGQGTEIHLPYYLGPPEPDKDFHLQASTLPDGGGGQIAVETLTWRVSPAASATIPAPGVFIPASPIGMGYIQAEDAQGNLSNRLYFFAATAPQ